MTSIILGENPEIPGLTGLTVSASEARLRDAHFDNDTDSWTITTADGRSVTARTLIDTRPSDDATLAVHGMPNLFRIPGPDTARQARYVRRCLDLLERSGATRIEAKSRVLLRRWSPRPLPARFFLTGTVPGADELFHGRAFVSLHRDDAADDVPVSGQFAGHLDAIDGQYHWRGTIAGDLPVEILKGSRAVTISTDRHVAQAKVTERTPWGGYTVSGVGPPPFALD